MKELLLVGVGGCIGSIARFKLGGLILQRSLDWSFPISTFAINVLGCLVAGVLAGLVDRYDAFSPGARVFLFTGLLGGFTTFSAFGLETATLLRRGDMFVACIYATLSVSLGIAAFWVGFLAVQHR